MPQMMGMKVGEIKMFDFSFPDPWEPVELAGVPGQVCCFALMLGWVVSPAALTAQQTSFQCLSCYIPLYGIILAADIESVANTTPVHWCRSINACLQVRVKVMEVLAWELPELTLEMCQGLQPGTTSVEDFMMQLREAVRAQAKEELQVGTALLSYIGD
jgi:hypothetical protein